VGEGGDAGGSKLFEIYITNMNLIAFPSPPGELTDADNSKFTRTTVSNLRHQT
jgi:hypothetical protein